jgi:hypothetical protein
LDRNGDSLTFRFTYRLIPGTSSSRDLNRVRTLEQGVRVVHGPKVPPALGTATLAIHSELIVPPQDLVDGRYSWELCAKDAAQIWQCTLGPEVRIVR